VAVLRVPARRAVVVAALLVGAMFAGSGPAFAAPAPPPTPPPNPSDQQLDQSKNNMANAAGQVGKLTGQLAAVQAEADQLGSKLEARQESANKALVDLRAAQDAARDAAQRVAATQVEAQAAAGAIEQAHQALDQFIAVAYEQGVQSGAFGLLMEASDPSDLVQRAELTQAVADQQQAALDGMQRARIAKVNSDSLARAAQLDAVAKQNAATGAKRTADGAVATAQAALAAGLAQLHQVDLKRADLEHQLDALTAQDAGLRAQRQQYLAYQAQVAAAARAAAAAAGARVAGGGVATGGVQGVIDRALSRSGDLRLGRRERHGADPGDPRRRGGRRVRRLPQDGFRLLGADALRVRRAGHRAAALQRLPVQRRQEGADLADPARRHAVLGGRQRHPPRGPLHRQREDGGGAVLRWRRADQSGPLRRRADALRDPAGRLSPS